MDMVKTVALTAVSGLVAGLAGCGGSSEAAKAPEGDSSAAPAGSEAAPAAAEAGAKHCCKGQNECKGKGNCKTDKNACKGQNECKGKGGCKAADCAP
jgi:hypothetical protein